MEQNRRHRIVKRVPFYKRIVNAPEDYIMKVGNDIRAMDWDMLQEGISWPLALGLNLLLASVKMGYWLDDPLANVPTILRSDRAHYSSKSMRPAFATLLASLQYLLVAVSFFNALWLFRSKKNYKMLERDLDERPLASSVKMVEVQQDESHWSFRFPGKLIYPIISPFMRGPKPQENKRQVWEMSVWDPSILSRNLFCWYSPAQVLILAAMNTDNFYIFFPLSVVVALQVHFLVSVYQSYVKDKQILFGEVQREYNVKFVYPRVFVRKYDKQVSTAGTDTEDLGQEHLAQQQPFRYGEDDDAGIGSEGRSGVVLGEDGSVSHFSTERRPKSFLHLSIPASSNGGVRFRGAYEPTKLPCKPRSSSPSGSEDEDEEKEEDEDEEEEDDEDDASDEDHSDSGSEDDSPDLDVDYDEEGEEPAVPHPINALKFD